MNQGIISLKHTQMAKIMEIHHGMPTVPSNKPKNIRIPINIPTWTTIRIQHITIKTMGIIILKNSIRTNMPLLVIHMKNPKRTNSVRILIWSGNISQLLVKSSSSMLIR